MHGCEGAYEREGGHLSATVHRKNFEDADCTDAIQDETVHVGSGNRSSRTVLPLEHASLCAQARSQAGAPRQGRRRLKAHVGGGQNCTRGLHKWE